MEKENNDEVEVKVFVNLLKNSNKSDWSTIQTIHESKFFGKAFSVSDVTSEMCEAWSCHHSLGGSKWTLLSCLLCFYTIFHTYTKTSINTT